MNDYESIPFVTEDGEEVEFYVLEQTTLNGFHYLLVEDGSADADDDVVVYIMKGAAGSEDEEEMAAYEMVEDEEELISVSKVFEQLMEDTDFEVE